MRPTILPQCRVLPQYRLSGPKPFVPQFASPSREFSTIRTQRSDVRSGHNGEREQAEQRELPRWADTPEQMKRSFSLAQMKTKDPRRSIWVVNSDPEKLDAMYNRLFGPNGHKLLPEEIKWLAVTHKSFDQGRRGFNTRLAYFGRQLLSVEAARYIVINPLAAGEPTRDPHGRVPFQHAALSGVDKLSFRLPRDILDPDRLARLAVDVGLCEVVRWKPRLPENLEGSGLATVLTTSVYAILGAICLQHGSEIGGRVAREKILRRLGL